MKNENVPPMDQVDQATHERLCAYVFGELQGEERAAFERELLASTALRAEHERLVATIGLVKRAIPDEGLSTAVRRDLVASARRSRFRFLKGRTLSVLVAAALLVIGGAVLLRYLYSPGGPFTYTLYGERVARAPDTVSLEEVRRNIEPAAGARLAERARESGPAGPAAGPRKSEEIAAVEQAGALEPAELEALENLGYAGETSGSGGETSNPDYSLDASTLLFSKEAGEGNQPLVPPVSPEEGTTYTWRDTSQVGLPPDASAGAAAAALQPPGDEGESAAVGHYGTGTPSTFVSRRAGAAAPGGPKGAASGPGAYRGPGDTKPPSRLQAYTPSSQHGRDVARALEPIGDGKKAPADAEESETLEALRGLGYAGDGEDDSAQNKRQVLRDEVRSAQLSPEQVDTLADRMLGRCGLQPGEAPRDMFYRYFGDRPFVLTLEERLSTFAVDVDTASYALARSYLNSGQLPPREAVRTEEFVNYFKADQPAPPSSQAGGDPFAIGLELAPSPFATDPRTEMLRVTVRGKDVASFERQSVALTFVIDNSGSMEQGGRLELVKRALSLLLRELRTDDSVAVVKFSNDAGVVTPMISAGRRGELEGLIQALPIEGGTNVEAGLHLGYEQALQTLQRNAVNRVILCSDGVGNIGETSAKGLLELVRDARAKGIYLNTVGVGMGNHDDGFLEELADKGDGVCHYVDSDAEAKRVFVDNLASAIQPIARDVKIQVELDPGQVESWRLLGYENRALRSEDFRNDKIDAGEVNAGHQVTALYELVRNPRPGTVATVRLRYKPPFPIDRGSEGARARAEAEQALEITRSIDGSAVLPGFASASQGFKRSALVAQFAEVLRRSVHARGDSFARLVDEARKLEASLADPDFTEFVALLAKANPLLDERAREVSPRVQELLDQLGHLHYEEALRERKRELAAQAGEAGKDAMERVLESSGEEQSEAERALRQRDEIQRLEQELRGLLRRMHGLDPADAPQVDGIDHLKKKGKRK